MPVAVQLVKTVEARDIIQRGWPVRMPRHVHFLPRARACRTDLVQDLLILLLERADLTRHVARLPRRGLTQLLDAPLELDQAALALDDEYCYS